jgi:hypothetical protein
VPLELCLNTPPPPVDQHNYSLCSCLVCTSPMWFLTKTLYERITIIKIHWFCLGLWFGSQVCLLATVKWEALYSVSPHQCNDRTTDPTLCHGLNLTDDCFWPWPHRRILFLHLATHSLGRPADSESRLSRNVTLWYHFVHLPDNYRGLERSVRRVPNIVI